MKLLNYFVIPMGGILLHELPVQQSSIRVQEYNQNKYNGENCFNKMFLPELTWLRMRRNTTS